MRIVFPDNTVLVKLGHLNCVHLIGSLFPSGTTNWCQSVANECRRSATAIGKPLMYQQASAVFGSPLIPQAPAEHIDITVLMEQWAQPGDPPHKNLGEAETLVLIDRRQIHAVFVTDDHGATKEAIARRILVIDTWRLLWLMHRSGLITEDDLWQGCLYLKSQNEGWPPCGQTRPAFSAWLNQR